MRIIKFQFTDGFQSKSAKIECTTHTHTQRERISEFPLKAKIRFHGIFPTRSVSKKKKKISIFLLALCLFFA